MYKKLIIICLMMTLSGCYTTKLYFADTTGPAGDSHKTIQHTFFWGLISPGSVNLDAKCGAAGVKKVRGQVGGWGLLANWFTGGIWIPVTIKVTCGE